MLRSMFRIVLPAIAALAATGAPAPAAEPAGLRVATFRCDVTPPVGGQTLISFTPLEIVEDPLLAKGIVFDDGRHRYVLCAVDWCGLLNSSHLLLRSKIAAAAGADVSRVAVQCVHQHTAPYVDGDAQRLLSRQDHPLNHYVDFKFLDDVANRLADSVQRSLKRLIPFDQVGVGQAKVERVASSRRVPAGDGTIQRRMSSCKDPKLRAAPEGFIDPLLRTITLAKAGKPLVRLHYYATHPQSFYGDARASADVPGFARDRLEHKEFVFQIYFTGCAGDVAMGKYNDATPRARGELADRLFAGMAASAASTRYVPVDRIQWRTAPLILEPRTDDRYDEAAMRAKMADPKEKAAARILAATAVAFDERARRPFELSAFCLGPACVLQLPGECMVEFQKYAVQLRPDALVAVAAYGDLAPGYVCTQRSFAEGGYEPTASKSAPSAEGLLKSAIRQLLAPDSPPAGLK